MLNQKEKLKQKLLKLRLLDFENVQLDGKFPNLWSLQISDKILELMFKADIEPTEIEPSVDDGVCFSFLKNERYAEFEVLNDKSIVVMLKNYKYGTGSTRVWEIEPVDPKKIESALKEIKTHINPHLSYSQLSLWARCSFQHYLAKIKKVSEFKGNEFTAFGRAIHFSCENMVMGEFDARKEGVLWELDFGKEYDAFLQSFRQELETFDSFDEKLVKEMEEQAKDIIPKVIPELKKTFGNYKVFDIEHLIYEEINDVELIKFMGYIDLVLVLEDGTLVVLDWKSCSWGWDQRKRSNKYVVYQLMLYKHYLSEKIGVEPKKIKTFYGLLKRTAKKEHVEIFEVSSGNVRTKNAFSLLRKSGRAINNGIKFKNKSNCTNKDAFGGWCQFYKTKHCP